METAANAMNTAANAMNTTVQLVNCASSAFLLRGTILKGKEVVGVLVPDWIQAIITDHTK
jgi:hypothetical protein